MSAKFKAIMLLASAFAWPITSYADGTDIPELGVHLAAPLDRQPAAEVAKRIDGYEAILRFGEATLSIGRLEEPVPSGSDIKDPAFRLAEEQEFYEFPDQRVHAQLTQVGGLDAWTTFSAQQIGDVIAYTCVTYIIVDRHLYRIAASAIGLRTRPPEFDVAVNAMSTLTFRAVDHSSLAGAEATRFLKTPKLKVKIGAARDWYPPAAKLAGEQGIVDLEFSIDGHGHARDLSDTFYRSKVLDEAARGLLQAATFGVTPDWIARYEHARFAMEVQYGLVDSHGHCDVGGSPYTGGAMVVTVCSFPVHARRFEFR